VLAISVVLAGAARQRRVDGALALAHTTGFLLGLSTG
jgi:hypothetical protein